MSAFNNTQKHQIIVDCNTSDVSHKRIKVDHDTILSSVASTSAPSSALTLAALTSTSAPSSAVTSVASTPAPSSALTLASLTPAPSSVQHEDSFPDFFPFQSSHQKNQTKNVNKTGTVFESTHTKPVESITIADGFYMGLSNDNRRITTNEDVEKGRHNFTTDNVHLIGMRLENTKVDSSGNTTYITPMICIKGASRSLRVELRDEYNKLTIGKHMTAKESLNVSFHIWIKVMIVHTIGAVPKESFIKISNIVMKEYRAMTMQGISKSDSRPLSAIGQKLLLERNNCTTAMNTILKAIDGSPITRNLIPAMQLDHGFILGAMSTYIDNLNGLISDERIDFYRSDDDMDNVPIQM